MSPRPDDPETAKTLETTRGAPVDVPLVLPDGVSLHARLWCPPEGRGPWPALLMRQPYGHAIASTVTYAHPSWWASHGFLVVVQDVRGQGASGGTFEGFAQERADTSATLTWLRNLAACNGRVGLYGFSYQGFTQLVAEPDSDPPDCLAVGAWQPYVSQYAAEGPYLHKHTAASRASWAMHEHDVARGTAAARAAMRKAVSRVARVSPGGDVSAGQRVRDMVGMEEVEKELAFFRAQYRQYASQRPPTPRPARAASTAAGRIATGCSTGRKVAPFLPFS